MRLPFVHTIFKLRFFNNLLSLVIIIFALYIIIMPLWPNIVLWWRGASNTQPPLVQANSQPVVASDTPSEQIPTDNTLVLPSISLQEVVHEGAGPATLASGLWRRPHTSTPDTGGNTVIAGHRFTYRGAAVFYHLDKVKIDDVVVLYWEGKKYVYTVSKISIVPPTAIEVEAPTDTPRLTLYTCTPLWTSTNRLVIEAVPVEAS